MSPSIHLLSSSATQTSKGLTSRAKPPRLFQSAHSCPSPDLALLLGYKKSCFNSTGSGSRQLLKSDLVRPGARSFSHPPTAPASTTRTVQYPQAVDAGSRQSQQSHSHPLFFPLLSRVFSSPLVTASSIPLVLTFNRPRFILCLRLVSSRRSGRGTETRIRQRQTPPAQCRQPPQQQSRLKAPRHSRAPLLVPVPVLVLPPELNRPRQPLTSSKLLHTRNRSHRPSPKNNNSHNSNSRRRPETSSSRSR